MKAGERIPTPWKQRWRRFRYSALPGLCFLACVVLMLSMWRQQGRLPNAVGEVESVRVEIAAGTDGRLSPLVDRENWWAPFETVEKDDLIAMKRRAASDPSRRRSKALRDEADVELLLGDVPDPDEGW